LHRLRAMRHGYDSESLPDRIKNFVDTTGGTSLISTK
jgi:hypothetical protein